jgi:putative glutamine transport system permease protein
MEQLLDPKRWSAFLELAIWRFLWSGLQITLSMAAIAAVSSLALGLVLAVLRLSRWAAVRYPAVVAIEVVRALPVLFLIFFAFFAAARAGLGLSPFGAGTLALTIYTSAVNAEIFRAGITSIERGQVEAARALGLTYAQAMRYVVLPQALRRMIPPQVGQLITLIKDTSLAAVIGVGELTRRAQIIFQSEFNPLQSLFVAACIYFAINYTLSLVSRRWELAAGGRPSGGPAGRGVAGAAAARE